MDGASSAIVIAIDRLGAGYLGPYGSAWAETPAFNRLASGALVCEHALTDSPRLETTYRSYWSGMHAMRGADADGGELPALLADAGIHTALLSDEPPVADHPLAARFAERIALPAEPVAAAADDVAQTQFAQLIAAAADWLDRAPTSSLLWIHSRGMQGPWDAPQDFRERLADEEDPPPPAFVNPPQKLLAEDYDPDELLGLIHAYAGQIALIDVCLGALLDSIDNAAGPPPLVALIAPRGYPLGEHRRVGAGGETLFGELLHVPWMLRFPGQSGEGKRTQALVQPPDLYSTLLEFFGAAIDERNAWGRSLFSLLASEAYEGFDRAAAIAESGRRALRTPAWFFTRQADDPPLLFRKPDDRWEVNEVANRCAGIVEQLAEAADEFEQAAQAGDRAMLAPLSGELREGID